MLRFLVVWLTLVAGGAAAEEPFGTQAGLDAWLAEFRPRALEAGLSESVLDQALNGVVYDPEVVKRDRRQSEFTKTIWEYLGTAVSDLRVKNGKAALARHDALLRQIETEFGVSRHVLVAIWGLESAYGTFRGSKPVIGSMASLAYDARRGAFFEEQLLTALLILQDGHTDLGSMTGSWAGAMGHTQFMPTSFRDLAVDFTGDGRRDIWGNDPSDALASTANYLKANGWQTGLPWGVEVRVPQSFDYTLSHRDTEMLPSAWAALGVVTPDGAVVPDHGPASLLLPAGHEGAAFLIFANFEVLESYNTADAYVIAVGHLADRIAGGPGLVGTWPIEDRALSYDERIELQERLTALGFDTQGIDAKIGPLTVDAVRGFQASLGQVPDGYASPRLLDALRAQR